MASHHHGINPFSATNSAATSCLRNCRCNSCSTCCFTQSHQAWMPSPPSAPPSPPPLDQLLQLIASYLQQKQCSDQIHLCKFSDHRSSGFKPHCIQQKKLQRVFQREDQCRQQEAQFLLSSLLQRIDSLESSLHRFSISSDHRYSSYSSLRDAAARVIQTHFRLFLVRRSKTLRDLKELAIIKSSFHSLKSSVSGQTHLDFESISREAMDLLMELDSIQGRDPMIRDGKRSLSRDLVRFLEYIDGCVVKRREILYRDSKKVRYGGNSGKYRSLRSKNVDFGLDKKETMDKSRTRIKKIRVLCNEDEDNLERKGFKQITDDGEEIPIIYMDNAKDRSSKNRVAFLVKRGREKSQVKKTVSFDEKGDVYKVYGNTTESTSSGDDNYTDGLHNEKGEATGNNHNEVEEIKCVPKQNEDDPEEDTENEGSSQSGDGEKQHGRNVSSLLFSAPLPLKMEPRFDI